MASNNLLTKIRDKVEKIPNQIAIEKGENKVAYGELYNHYNMIANNLFDKIAENKNVFLFLEKGISLIESLLGVMQAGGVFIPLDPNLPENRIKMVLDLVQSNWIITEKHNLSKLESLIGEGGKQINILVLDAEEKEVEGYNLSLSTLDKNVSRQMVTDDEKINRNAYIYFTSGSTGKPKGIVGRHVSLNHFITWEIGEFKVNEGFRVSQLTPPSFDPFLRDVFVPLCAGGTLCIPEDREIILNPAKLVKWIDEKDIVLIHMVPSLFKQLSQSIEDTEVFKNLKYILLAGELLRGRDIKPFISLFKSKVQLVNVYGPSETTLAKMFYPVQEGDVERSVIPVGKPISNTEILILDQDLKRCLPGSLGEVYIRTPYTSAGYYKDMEQTKKAFIKNPFNDNPKDIIYKTGDLGRLLGDGNIELVGRADHQVKIRGHRIEMGEIEKQLLAHENIKEAIVMAEKDQDENSYLSAYLVGNKDFTVLELRKYLLVNLPEYMIPSKFVQVETMPLSPNGKIDRKSLVLIEDRIPSGVEYEAPRDEFERELVAIWQDILSRDNIGINDDFFDLGGHSLRATALVTKIHQTMNIEIPLGEIFKIPTIKGLSEYIKGASSSQFSAIEVVPEAPYYPVSSAQRRLYTLQQFDLESTSYNIPTAVMLEGSLDTEKLEDTFKRLIQRHESLRTSFELMGEEPVQILQPTVDFKVQYIESNELGKEKSYAEDLQKLMKDFVKPFGLDQAPLLRVGLVKIEDEKHLLMVDMHHIISDGSSMGIFIKEFTEFYQGIEPQSMRVQYKDYSQWQKNQIETGKIDKQKEFWLNRFEGEIPVLNLIGDYPRPAIQSFEGNRLNFQLDEESTTAIKRVAKETGTTTYMILLSVFNILLSKYSGQEDIVVGSPIAGRNHGDLRNMMGVLINTLAMRNYPVGEKSFKAFLAEVKENALAAYENQDYQFEELVENLNVKRDISRNPLFDVMFTMQNMDTHQLAIEGLRVKSLEMESNMTKFDMSLTAFENESSINLQLEYATKIFKKETIERLYGHFQNILKQITENRGICLNEIELVTEGEKQQILEVFNPGNVDYPKDKTIYQLFEEQVEKTPNHIAVKYKDENLTYLQLNEKANQLARKLKEKGVEKDTIVAILVDRSLEMLVGIMAILKAGGAYLPIDPEYPEDRIQYMLEDSEAKILLTQSWYRDKSTFGGEIIGLDDKELYRGDGRNFDITIPSDALAYIIYTSGSTGKPKGVMISHNSAANFIQGMANQIKFDEGKTILALTTISFDIFFLETLLPLVKGLKVVVASEEDQVNPIQLKELIEKEKIDMLQVTPSRLKMILEYEDDNSCLKDLREIMIGGEALPTSLLREIQKVTDAKIYNMYGPTETTIWSTVKSFEKEKDVTIGRPIANTQIYIVDQNDHLQPIGVAGELCIGGIGLARGYLNRPDLTAERFVENPFLAREKMYRTGDLVRWLSNGEIEYIGRIDHQVKIRGYRIELGEVENQLLNFESIKEAIVVAKEDESANKFLCGYIVADEELELTELKKKLLQQLPEYMVPTYILQLKEMPLTPNGKINRRALPEPEGSFSAMTEYEAPQNEIEEKLVEIWEEIFGIEGIGINHNFFELGGHSLKATSLVVKMYKKFDIKVPLNEIFKRSTIKGLGEYIAGSTGTTAYERIPLVEEKPYYEVSSSQKRLYVLNQLDPQGITFNMPSAVVIEGKLDIEQVKAAFNKLIMRHESLRTSFHNIDDEVVQKIHGEFDFDIELKHIQEEAIETELVQWIKPFDLQVAPLIRVMLLEISEEKHVLVFDMHHIISDGTSLSILVEEFVTFYREQELPKLEVQYKDFAAWQNNHLKSEDMKASEDYWLKELDFSEDGLPVLNLPTDFKRPNIKNIDGEIYTYTFNSEVTKRIQGLAQQRNATLFMVLLELFSITLSKYTQQEDMIIGTVTAGRTHGEVENLIGVFLNNLAFRCTPSKELSAVDYLAKLKDKVINAFDHQHYPIEELIDKLDIPFDMSRRALFDVMIIHQNFKEAEVDLMKDDLKVKTYNANKNTSEYDITLFINEVEGDIILHFEYSTSLFKTETIKQMALHLENIATQIVSNPQIQIKDLKLATEQEKNLILNQFTGGKRAYNRNKTIDQYFEEQVAKNPEHVALVFKENNGTYVKMTYGELNKRANQLARTILEKYKVNGFDSEIIGIISEKSLEMIVGILATLKAGKAYLPIDPVYPTDRINYMLKDADGQLLLKQDSISHNLAFDGEVISLDDEASYIQEDTNLNVINKPDDLIYVIYTSGTTGHPKGILTEHRNVIAYTSTFVELFSLGEGDATLQQASITFDGFVEEVYSMFMVGGRIVIPKSHEVKDIHVLHTLVKENDVTILSCSPLIMNEFNKLETLSSVHTYLSSSDILNKEYYSNLIKAANVYNMYGPTETTVCTTCYTCTGKETNVVPIGGPIDNYKLFILDENFNMMPFGVPGEIYISGDGVSRGYLNNPELTADRFVKNPFAEDGAEVSSRMYRTGDIGRLLPDGSVEFLGRGDHQVKIRGYRIETDEIENKILNHPQINEAIIVVGEDENSKYLIAYYVGKKEIATVELKHYLGQNLPHYMIPQYFIQLDKLPLTPNGKIDRRALPQPNIEAMIEGEYVEARNDVEKKLVEIWSRILKLEKVGVTQDFFTIGGNSINILKVASEIEKEFNIRFNIAELFTNSTIAQIAENIEGENVLQGLECIVKLNNSPSKRNVFILHGAEGDVYYYKDLAKELEEECTLYGIQARGLVRECKLPETPLEMLSYYLKEIKEVQPEGPYYIAGYCVGAVLAYELVKMMEDQGDKVELLFEIDEHAFIPDFFLKVLAAKQSVAGIFKGGKEDKYNKKYKKVADRLENADFTSSDKEFIPDRNSLKENIQSINKKFAPHGIINTKVLVIKAEENHHPRFKIDNWRMMTHNEVELVEIPGTHDSIVTNPDVVGVGEAMKEALRGNSQKTTECFGV